MECWISCCMPRLIAAASLGMWLLCEVHCDETVSLLTSKPPDPVFPRMCVEVDFFEMARLRASRHLHTLGMAYY